MEMPSTMPAFLLLGLLAPGMHAAELPVNVDVRSGVKDVRVPATTAAYDFLVVSGVPFVVPVVIPDSSQRASAFQFSACISGKRRHDVFVEVGMDTWRTDCPKTQERERALSLGLGYVCNFNAANALKVGLEAPHLHDTYRTDYAIGPDNFDIAGRGRSLALLAGYDWSYGHLVISPAVRLCRAVRTIENGYGAEVYVTTLNAIEFGIQAGYRF